MGNCIKNNHIVSKKNLTQDQKIDRILELLESGLTPLELDAKNNIKDYMLKHLNISWIDDTTEADVYDTLLTVIFKII